MNNGIMITKSIFDGVSVTRTKITTNQGMFFVNAPIGDYSDISFRSANEKDICLVSEILAKELRHIAPVSPGSTVLVFGLGNRKIPADSLGPETIEKLEATRALGELFPDDFNDIVKICAISLEVIGNTGISVQETAEMYSKSIRPDLIIIIDALDVQSVSHIGHTIALCNTGLLQNRPRNTNLTEETLGAPVVVIGIPFITDTATIANDVMEVLLPALVNSSDDAKWIFRISDYEKRMTVIREAISRSNIKNSIFTPENIAVAIEQCSEIIARGVHIWANAESDTKKNILVP